ncbi:butyrophilin subfamily 1 member A1-like [Astatotilapia calliptera]|uniref:butyrophilin subfamily 1 member A1-like n=1 Tax=Astatotilapia calliptera TaxID=8154 RepID=UPI000E405ACB|nr:butyrophilin subfamily 1 member A1-like [Astatotilapia calliptera]
MEMFAGTSHSLFWVYLVSITCSQLSASADQKAATAGQNVTLTCQAPNNYIGVEWSRTDLKDEYVLLYRNGHFDPDHQHPSFKNRVDLQDRQMKDGDVSLILNNVTISDNGTYECRVKIKTNREQRAVYGTEPICSIDLSVVPPGQTGGHTEDGRETSGSDVLKAGLSVLAVLLVAVF